MDGHGISPDKANLLVTSEGQVWRHKGSGQKGVPSEQD